MSPAVVACLPGQAAARRDQGPCPTWGKLSTWTSCRRRTNISNLPSLNPPAGFFIALFPPDPSREPSNLVNLALNQAAEFVHSSKNMGNTQKVFDMGNTLVL